LVRTRAEWHGTGGPFGPTEGPLLICLHLSWYVDRPFEDVRKELVDELYRWADHETVVVVSDNPLLARATRGREFVQLEAKFVDLSVPPVIWRKVHVDLSIRRNEYLGEFDH
jgi:hypothetical protein